MSNALIAVQQQSATQKKTTLALIAVFTTYFSSTYIFRGVAVASPRIAADLNGMALYSWAISLPALGAAFVTLISGKLSDMYGRRLLLTLCLLLYMIGAVLAATSQTFIFYIGARVLLSLGQGALAPLCFSVLGDLFPPAERSKWSGLLQVPAGISAMFIPTCVGIMTDSLSWRYFFWIALLLAALGGCWVVIGIPALEKKSAHKVDVLGSCLLAVASSTAILAFSWAGSTYSWTSIRITGLLAISVVFWSIFLWVEQSAEEPMLSFQVLTNRVILTAAAAAFFSSFGMLVITMYYPLFLQGIQGASATLSGQILTPFNMLMSFVGVPTGFVLARTKRWKRMYVAGYGTLAIVMFATVFFNAATPFWLGVLVSTVAGLGIGSIPTMNTLAAQFAVPKRLLGVAVAAMFFFVFLSMAISPAIMGSVMNASYARHLQAFLPVELTVSESISGHLANPRVLLSKTALSALRRDLESIEGPGTALFDKTVQAIRNSMQASLRDAFIIGAVTMLISFLLIATLPEVSMNMKVEDKSPQR